MTSPKNDPKPTAPPAPFASLLAASSLVFAVLLVAGFSYRWTYYYNFGLKDLALAIPVQSVLLGALELIRTPSDALFTICVVALPLVVLNSILLVLDRFRAWAEARKLPAIGSAF